VLGSIVSRRLYFGIHRRNFNSRTLSGQIAVA